MDDKEIMIRITIPSLFESFDIDIKTSITVQELCDEITLDLAPDQFCSLWFNENKLDNIKTLKEYGVRHGQELIFKIETLKQNNSNILESQEISITVYLPDKNKSYNMRINRNRQISELINQISYAIQLSKNQRISLSYQGIGLQKEGIISEYGIQNDSNLTCQISSCGGGFDPFQFSNMENMQLEAPGKNCKDWRKAKSGLNLPGICNNEQCEAYNLQVICPKGNGTFNMAEEIENMVCPQCKSDKVTAEGDCYFWDCKYSFKGCANIGGTKMKKEESEKECPKGQFVHFMGEDEQAQCSWSYLTITTRKM